VVVDFIDGHKERFGVAPICRVLSEHGCKIAPSTYYAARSRGPSARDRRDSEVLAQIVRVHAGARGGLYGRRKIYHQLRRDGVEVGGAPVAMCTIERLMRANGLHGARRGRFKRTTVADPGATRAPDLVGREFAAAAPNRLWVVDFTYVATWAGFAYTAFAIDVFSRMIVGWRVAATMVTDLPLDALEMALWHRTRGHKVNDGRLKGLIHHSDAGSQYTSIRYTDRLLETGLRASIGTVGDSYDNALAETVIGLYKTELVHWEGPFAGPDDLELATLSWVHWFNNTRLHSALCYRTPTEVETEYYRLHTTPAERPLAGQPTV
jgi:putative transposase